MSINFGFLSKAEQTVIINISSKGSRSMNLVSCVSLSSSVNCARSLVSKEILYTRKKFFATPRKEIVTVYKLTKKGLRLQKVLREVLE